MAKGIEKLHAEWLKRDSIKILMEQDSTNPIIGSLEQISAGDFQSRMIEGVKQLGDELFVQMLQTENVLDSNGYFNEDVLKQKEEKAPPNYGFEPRNIILVEELQKRLSDEQLHITPNSIKKKKVLGNMLIIRKKERRVPLKKNKENQKIMYSNTLIFMGVFSFVLSFSMQHFIAA